MKNHFGILFISALISLLSSCLGTSYLQKDEKLLYKQSFKGIKGLDQEILSKQLLSHPNRRLPVLNWSYYTSMYHIGEKFYKPQKAIEKKKKIERKFDRKLASAKKRKKAKLIAKKNRKIEKANRLLKEGNFFMRWGEPVTTYDSVVSAKSTLSLKNYLGTIGFFDAQVAYRTNYDGKRAEVTYVIDRGTPYVVDSIHLNIRDEKIKEIVRTRKNAQAIKEGQRYRQSQLIAERDRITDILNNEGYYDFKKQFISFQIDTSSLASHEMLIQLSIANPEIGRDHKQFTIDSVIFITHSNDRLENPIVQREYYNDITFVHGKRRFSPKILDWRLFLYPDSLYRKKNYFETQRQISNLDMFKFVNIRNDTSDGRFISTILTSPLKKYQTSNEIGVNVNQGLPGPFFNVSLKNRNSFRALEILELAGKLGVEGIGSFSDQQDTYSSFEYGGTLSQTFPQFLFPFSRAYQSRVGKYNPSTKFSVGINYINRPEYNRNNLFGSVTYSWQKGLRKSFSLTPMKVNFIESNLTTEFQDLLDTLNAGNDRLINSFRSSFVTSTSFIKTLNINTYGNSKSKSYYAKLDLESGGALLRLFGSTPFGSNFQHFQYARVLTDLRMAVPVNRHMMNVYRISVGAAYAYGGSETLPYEKFLFAGGSNGIRAWKPRRLGPGSFQQLNAEGEITQDFEQPATLLLEGNLETRFDLFSFFEGAFFLDFGNTWLIDPNNAKPGAAISLDEFFNEIAVGTGFGLRLDFSLLILRLDMGLKVHDPIRDKGDRFIWSGGFSDQKYSALAPLVLNIGIGYPF